MLSENLVNSIQQLIVLGKGDRGRLEYILELVTRGKILPLSDQRYLEGILALYLGSQDAESFQRHIEQMVNSMSGEVKCLGERLEKLERVGFERYIGKKAVFFFATAFVGWHAFQDSIVYALGGKVSPDILQYLFPLNSLANSVGQGSLVWLSFVFMALAWPFIGAVHLTRFIRAHKISPR